MNDFTKEELKILKAAMGEILFFPETPRLIDKIQSMLDNYCEHEYENDFGKDSRPRFEKNKNPKCKKCEKFYR